jgi:hypothetical protein
MWLPLSLLIAASAVQSDIRPVLREQRFDGPLNGREKIKYVGHITQGRNDYEIYVFRGVFRAAAVDHGVSKLIVILNGSTFFGEYKIAMPTDCKVRGPKVICNAEYPGRVIEFTKQGPPHKIWFDGEVDQIEFGNRMQKKK